MICCLFSAGMSAPGRVHVIPFCEGMSLWSIGLTCNAVFCFAVSLAGFAGSSRNLTIPVRFDFIRISLSGGNHADIVFPQGINNNDFETIDDPSCCEAALAVILTLIQSFDAIFIEKNPCSNRERNTVLFKVRGGFP